LSLVRDEPSVDATLRWRVGSQRATAESWQVSGALIALIGITAVGFALRVAGMDQSLYGDERYTYSIVTGHGLGGVWHQVYSTSITPPLHYYLAWLSVQFGGDKTILVRLPSLLLGTATIPLLYVLAKRIGGTAVGLLAAGLLALSPFAIFYSTEARAYETVVFLVTVSTLALLKARDGGRAWWVVYIIASCAAIWAHYTAAQDAMM
jgi:4-amino-4-deoxy-L-arabinose transferase-like glycosyltransferase